MGKVIVYTGQAGTGKTTSLIKLLNEAIPEREWAKHEAILALTFMHGSRKRLDSKLVFIKKDHKIRYQCSTIDSFALNLLNRFRSYLNISKPIIVSIEGNDSEDLFEIHLSLETLHKHVIDLLQFASVRKFISNSYPYIIIDEFQDCSEGRLEFIKQLSSATDLLIAADAFQYLADTEKSDAMTWIEQNDFEVYDLDQGGVKRTNNNKILLTSSCLRNGQNIDGGKIKVLGCPSQNLSAVLLKTNIHFNLGQGNIAIITPTKGAKFVKDTVEALSKEHTFKSGDHKGKVIGPYNHLVSSEESIDWKHLIKDVPERPLSKEDLKILKGQKHFVLKRSAERLLKKMSIRNITTVPYEFFVQTVNQTHHTYETFYRQENRSPIIYTTIHGAKNREFDTVIVIWPYQVAGSLLYKRKLLYNAITRARKNVIVIAQSKSDKIDDLIAHELFGLIVNEEQNN